MMSIQVMRFFMNLILMKELIEVTFSLGPEIHVYEATMVAVGDILLHDTVYNDFSIDEKTFDFSPLLKILNHILNLLILLLLIKKQILVVLN